MRKYLVPVVLFLSTVPAWGNECVYDKNVVSKYDGEITNVTSYVERVENHVADTRICKVQFNAKVKHATYFTQASYVFGPDMSQNDACNQAAIKAKQDVLRSAASEVISARVNTQCRTNTIEVARDGALKKTGRVVGRIFQYALCGTADCLN
jgi:hypothetical protein